MMRQFVFLLGFLLWGVAAWFMPQLTLESLSWFSLDAPAKAWSVLVLWAAIWQLYGRWSWVTPLQAGLVWGIVGAQDLRLVAGGMLLLSLLPQVRKRGRLALVLAAVTVLWWGWRAETWLWTEQALGAWLDSVVITGLCGAVGLGLGLLPFQPRQPQLPHSLIMLALFTPCWRLYQTGPLNLNWALVGLASGTLAATWLLLSALRSSDALRRIGLAQAWWCLSFAPLLLASETGLAATWALSFGAVLVHAAVQRGLAGWSLWLVSGSVLPSIGFIGLWLAAGASLAGGLPVFLGVLWLNALLLMLVSVLVESGQRNEWLLPAASVVSSLAITTFLYRLVEPMLQVLGAGLTPYGRSSFVPWVGLQVRDAGSVTATALPVVVMGGMLCLVGAVAWLLVRPLRQLNQSDRLSTATLWRLVQRRLPWSKLPEVSDEL